MLKGNTFLHIIVVLEDFVIKFYFVKLKIIYLMNIIINYICLHYENILDLPLPLSSTTCSSAHCMLAFLKHYVPKNPS